MESGTISAVLPVLLFERVFLIMGVLHESLGNHSALTLKSRPIDGL